MKSSQLHLISLCHDCGLKENSVHPRCIQYPNESLYLIVVIDFLTWHHGVTVCVLCEDGSLVSC